MRYRQYGSERGNSFQKTQAKDKAIADQHKRAVEVEAGDRVLLSTRNLKLKGKTGTFKPKYVGPFPILRMGEATSTWYLGQVMMPPRTSGYLSESCSTVENC